MTPAELLIQAYLEDSLSEAEAAALHAWLAEDSAHVDRFTIECLLHGQLCELLSEQDFREDLLASALVPPRHFVPEQEAVRPKSQTLLPVTGLPVTGRPATSRSPVLGFLDRMMHVSGDTPVATALMWMVMFLCTGMLLTMIIGIIVMVHGVNVHVDAPQVAQQPVVVPSPSLPSPPATVARLIHTAECRWAAGSNAPDEGDDLLAGRKLALKSGLAEIMFQSGARAVLQGPATLEVASKTSALLQRGKVTVTVEEPAARGFQINTPGMKFTDFGTEFGVLVTKDGMQEVHVFRGKVQAEEVRDQRSEIRDQKPGDLPRPTSDLRPPTSPIVLSANQAIRVAAPGKPIEQIPFDQKQFVRKLPDVYAELVLSMHPVAYYRLERPKEAKDRLLILDSAGGHNGTLHLGQDQFDPYVAGHSGDSLSLRGLPTADCVIVPDYPVAKGNQLSISAWAWAESRPTWASVAANWGDTPGAATAGQFHFGCYGNDGDLAVVITSAAGRRIEVREGRTSPFPLGVWQHVAFTIDGKVARVYRNGYEVASSPCSGIAVEPLVRSLGIGCKTDDSGLRPGSIGFWHGRIDELALFHRALSADEVQSLSKGKQK